MTREDIITNLRYWCNNIEKPCEECKMHDICVVRDHVQTFDSMDDKKLQEYYKLMYGSEMKVEKMEPVKVLDNTPKKPKTGAGYLRMKRGNINER